MQGCWLGGRIISAATGSWVTMLGTGVLRMLAALLAVSSVFSVSSQSRVRADTQQTSSVTASPPSAGASTRVSRLSWCGTMATLRRGSPSADTTLPSASSPRLVPPQPGTVMRSLAARSRNCSLDCLNTVRPVMLTVCWDSLMVNSVWEPGSEMLEMLRHWWCNEPPISRQASTSVVSTQRTLVTPGITVAPVPSWSRYTVARDSDSRSRISSLWISTNSTSTAAAATLSAWACTAAKSDLTARGTSPKLSSSTTGPRLGPGPTSVWVLP